MSPDALKRGGFGLFWFGLMTSMGAVAGLWSSSIGAIGVVSLVAGIGLFVLTRARSE